MCPNVAKRIGAATYTTVAFSLIPTVLGTNGRPSQDCSSEPSEEYDKGLHIAAIFIVLVSSALGITLPILTKGLASTRTRAKRVWDEAVFMCVDLLTNLSLIKYLSAQDISVQV